MRVAMVGALCGGTAAVLAAPGVLAGDGEDAPRVSVAALDGFSLAGRWSGTPYAIRNDAARCDNGDCKLVLDIVPCASGWCGIEVARAGTCAAERMQLKTHSDPKRRHAFEGKLSLGAGTQDYVVDVHAEPAAEGQPPMLEVVGDTGPEFRWFRRSFPFHATLARIGDAVCKSTDRPVG